GAVVDVDGDDPRPRGRGRHRHRHRPPAAAEVDERPRGDGVRHGVEEHAGAEVEAVAGEDARGGADLDRSPAQDDVDGAGLPGGGRLRGEVVLAHSPKPTPPLGITGRRTGPPVGSWEWWTTTGRPWQITTTTRCRSATPRGTSWRGCSPGPGPRSRPTTPRGTSSTATSSTARSAPRCGVWAGCPPSSRTSP